MTSLFQPVLVLHIACGLIAVVIGLPPIFTRKGKPAHRWWGRLFAGVMGTLLVAAWVMTGIHFNAYFAALTATATLTLFSGVRVLRRKRPDLKSADRAQPLDWAMTLAVIGVGVWVLVVVITGQAGARATVSVALIYGAFATGGWDLWRFARPTDWPFSPELWRYEHLAKMLSAYAAVLSAFSGNFLDFLPTPWSQLWPTLVFQPLAIGWIAWLVVRRRIAPAAA